MVTVLDGHPHTLAFLSTINQVRATHLGLSHFGQSGTIEDVYHYHSIDTDSIVRATLTSPSSRLRPRDMLRPRPCGTTFVAVDLHPADDAVSVRCSSSA